jgi:tripartite-type tricarboxylate transporter receptor subunit TctC
MKITRRTLLGTIAAGRSAGASFEAFAQGEWPTQVVRLISPYGAGGANDISLRILAEQLGRNLNQQFIVENKPGAGTRVATEHAARATADGYTLLYAAAPFATAEALFGKLNYDRKDLQPVAMAVAAPIFLVVNANSSIKTAQDLIAYGKSRPGGLTFASPGAGSQPHLAAELLFMDAGVKGLNVAYRGDAMAYTELLAGRVDATLTAISTGLPHIESGKLRVLGVASGRRRRLVRLHGAGCHAARARRADGCRAQPRARRSRGQAEAASPGTGSAGWHRRRLRKVHRRRDPQMERGDPRGGPQGRVGARNGAATGYPACCAGMM